MKTMIRKLFWISPVVFLLAFPLYSQEGNRRGRIVINSQEIATWMTINNSFADPNPQSSEEGM